MFPSNRKMFDSITSCFQKGFQRGAAFWGLREWKVELQVCKRSSRDLLSHVLWENALKSCLSGTTGGTEKLREILLTSAHIKCISSLGFCTVIGLCRPQLVMNSRSEHSPPEGSKDSPRTGNSPSSEWEWTHVLLLRSQICSGWQDTPELS